MAALPPEPSTGQRIIEMADRLLQQRWLRAHCIFPRVQLDPFFVHGVVEAEIHGMEPSRVVEGFAALAA